MMDLSTWRPRSPLLRELDDECYGFLASIAEEVHYPAHATIFREDEAADRFFVVTRGTVALRIMGPAKRPVTIQTIGEAGLLGLSWFLPPYRWQWTAQAVDDVTMAKFDANAALSRCESNLELENVMLRVIAKEAYKRLQNVRLQLVDVYGKERT